MDEKFLEEIRRQEKLIENPDSEDSELDDAVEESNEEVGEPSVTPPTGQRTLFGGESQ